MAPTGTEGSARSAKVVDCRVSSSYPWGLIEAIACRSLIRLLFRRGGAYPRFSARQFTSLPMGAEGEWLQRTWLAGYHDQAHLIGEFRALIGVMPIAYAQGRGIEALARLDC